VATILPLNENSTKLPTMKKQALLLVWRGGVFGIHSYSKIGFLTSEEHQRWFQATYIFHLIKRKETGIFSSALFPTKLRQATHPDRLWRHLLLFCPVGKPQHLILDYAGKIQLQNTGFCAKNHIIGLTRKEMFARALIRPSQSLEFMSSLFLVI
jgi:hypothetical protein